LADMRFAGDIFLGQTPQGQVSRVVEFQPAIGAVHRDTLEEVVEGGAADASERSAGPPIPPFPVLSRTILYRKIEQFRQSSSPRTTQCLPVPRSLGPKLGPKRR